MNTYDIRNMDTKQWLFWATAVPVTVLVMGLAVVAVLNFDPVRALWARVVDRDNSQRVGREELREYLDGDADRRRDDRQSYETPPELRLRTERWTPPDGPRRRRSIDYI